MRRRPMRSHAPIPAGLRDSLPGAYRWQVTLRRSRNGKATSRSSSISRGKPMPNRIEDYALIGDCESAALVSRDGSIDWLCWPRFDSDACFAALLGTPEHGRWRVAPTGEITRCTRRYRGDTLVLETDLETADGAVTVIDFMPPRTVESD